MGCLLLIAMIFGAGFLGFNQVATMPVEPAPIVINVINYDNIPQNRTDDGAFILGNPDAALTVVAWEDFLCPHCQNYQPILQQFIEEYVVTGQARLEFRMLPISQQSSFVFGLVECADTLEPGTFWEAHDVMFQLTSLNGFPDSTDFANQLGLPHDELLDCTADANQYTVDATFANTFAEVTGTPTLGWRLNDGPVQFTIISRQPSFEELEALVEFISQ